MSLLSDLKKIETRDLLLIIEIFLATAAPGFLVILYYKPELVKEYDFLKLLMFSCALTFPSLALNTFSVSATFQVIQEKNHEEESDIKDDLMIASVITFIMYYLALLIIYLFNLKFIWFVCIIGICQILLFVICIIISTRKKDSKSK
jgi:cell division protein FtsW (lipid II flippase)